MKTQFSIINGGNFRFDIFAIPLTLRAAHVVPLTKEADFSPKALVRALVIYQRLNATLRREHYRSCS